MWVILVDARVRRVPQRQKIMITATTTTVIVITTMMRTTIIITPGWVKRSERSMKKNWTKAQSHWTFAVVWLRSPLCPCIVRFRPCCRQPRSCSSSFVTHRRVMCSISCSLSVKMQRTSIGGCGHCRPTFTSSMTRQITSTNRKINVSKIKYNMKLMEKNVKVLINITLCE